jgi:hypothetical protein
MTKTCSQCRQVLPHADEIRFRFCPLCGVKLDARANRMGEKDTGAGAPAAESVSARALYPHSFQSAGEQPSAASSDVQLPPTLPPRSLYRLSSTPDNAHLYSPPEYTTKDKNSRKVTLLSFGAGILTAALLLLAMTII